MVRYFGTRDEKTKMGWKGDQNFGQEIPPLSTPLLRQIISVHNYVCSTKVRSGVCNMKVLISLAEEWSAIRYTVLDSYSDKTLKESVWREICIQYLLVLNTFIHF